MSSRDKRLFPSEGARHPKDAAAGRYLDVLLHPLCEGVEGRRGPRLVAEPDAHQPHAQSRNSGSTTDQVASGFDQAGFGEQHEPHV